ncbi:MAG: glutamine synthetase [Acidimicrobiia bacterium]|nr:glutamine synthetase [Acidimicrobiia bacterium]
MSDSSDATRALVDELHGDPADYVKVAIVDIDGVLRGKYLDKAKFVSALADGFGFCDVVFGWDSADECYDNGSYTGWQSGYPDGTVRIDPTTHRRVPWEGGRHFFLCDYVGSDPATVVCPRRLLQRTIDRAASAGYRSFQGMEFEWFNFRESPQTLHDKDFRHLEPLSPGMFGYSVLRQTHGQDFFGALLSDLRAFDVPLEGLHTETGPGVYEAALIYSEALEAADRAELFKSGAKEIGHRFGILPTFMARWNTDLPGCSGHVHQSLRALEGEANLFHDPEASDGMSSLFRSYLAGILELLPEMLVLFAPTVNSYKRLVDGFWAPTRPTWGIDNRTVACRVIPGGPKATRLELRVPGADVNPYLAVAGGLAAGLWGVEQGLELDRPPTQGSGYADESVARLPRTLIEATRLFADSERVRGLLGDDFVDHFAATREWEWRQFVDSVTDWELRRYLEII